MSAEWLERDMLCFDTETTGINVELDRIVTATCAHVGRDGVKDLRSWWQWPSRRSDRIGLAIAQEVRLTTPITHDTKLIRYFSYSNEVKTWRRKL